jgi:hypothetical protein
VGAVLPYPVHLTLERQHLIRRATSRAWRRVVRDLIGVQAQYQSAAALGLAARVEDLSAETLTRALYRERTLLRTWLIRGTLHFALPEDWSLLTAVYTEHYLQKAARSHRLWPGVEPALLTQWVYPAVLEALADGPLTYAQIAERTQPAFHCHPDLARVFNSWGGILIYMSWLGKVLMVDSAPGTNATRVARAEQWLKAEHLVPFEGTPEEATATLLRRYLRTYGPATPADFQRWSVCGQLLGRAAWAKVDPELASLPGGLYLLRSDLKRLKKPAPDVPTRLVPKFDAMVLAYREQTRIVPAAFLKHVYRPAGQIEAVLLVGGRAAGTWRSERCNSTLIVRLSPFGKLPRSEGPALEQEAGRFARFFGLERAEVVTG